MTNLNVVVLAGGVGGAKLADGFAQIVPSENLTVIVNTGDDFQYMGLTVCPDLDTVMYMLAGENNLETGWGRTDESWRTISEVARLGGPEWFRLGDLDLATHLIRSHILFQGGTLTEATQHLCRHFGVAINLLPMSNESTPTLIDSDEGLLSFQTWFVAKGWQPVVKNVCLPEDAMATALVVSALEQADLIAIAPSNPFVSIDPILNVYPIRAMITDLAEMVVAVSPIVEGKAVKGPAAKMMSEMGMEISSSAIASYYGRFIDAFVYDRRDDEIDSFEELSTLRVDTVMNSSEDRRRVAEQILDFCMELINR